MPWEIRLENENGKAIQILDEIFDYEELEKLTLPKFKVLEYIDPYGNTIFNCLQIDDLIADLNLLRTISEQEKAIKEIILLAEKCKAEVHTYLKFYGD